MSRSYDEVQIKCTFGEVFSDVFKELEHKRQMQKREYVLIQRLCDNCNQITQDGTGYMLRWKCYYTLKDFAQNHNFGSLFYSLWENELLPFVWRPMGWVISYESLQKVKALFENNNYTFDIYTTRFEESNDGYKFKEYNINLWKKGNIAGNFYDLNNIEIKTYDKDKPEESIETMITSLISDTNNLNPQCPKTE